MSKRLELNGVVIAVWNYEHSRWQYPTEEGCFNWLYADMDALKEAGAVEVEDIEPPTWDEVEQVIASFVATAVAMNPNDPIGMIEQFSAKEALKKIRKAKTPKPLLEVEG